MIDDLGHSESHPMQLQGSEWSLEGTGELALVHQQTLQNLSHLSLILQMVSFDLSILTLCISQGLFLSIRKYHLLVLEI